MKSIQLQHAVTVTRSWKHNSVHTLNQNARSYTDYKACAKGSNDTRENTLHLFTKPAFAPEDLGFMVSVLDYSNWTLSIVYHIVADTSHNRPEKEPTNAIKIQHKNLVNKRGPWLLFYSPLHVAIKIIPYEG